MLLGERACSSRVSLKEGACGAKYCQGCGSNTERDFCPCSPSISRLFQGARKHGLMAFMYFIKIAELPIRRLWQFQVVVKCRETIP